MTLYQPRLVYTTAEHGTSIKTFYNCVDEVEPTLLVMKTAKNEVCLGSGSSSRQTRVEGTINLLLQRFEKCFPLIYCCRDLKNVFY